MSTKLSFGQLVTCQLTSSLKKQQPSANTLYWTSSDFLNSEKQLDMLQPDAVENWVKVKTMVVYCKWIIRIYVFQYIEFIGQNSYKAL